MNKTIQIFAMPFALGLVTLSLSTAQGAVLYPGSCGKVFQPGINRKVEVEVTLKDPKPTAQEVESVQAVINSVNQNLTSYLNLPETVRLKISQTSTGAWHMGGSNEVSVPYQKLFRRQSDFRQEWTEVKSKHPIFTQAIIAHEYGHALFEENIADKVGAYLISVVPKLHEADRKAHAQELKELSDQMADLKKQKQQVVDQQRDLLFNHNPFPQKEYDALTEVFYELNRKIALVEEQISNLLPLAKGIDLFTYNTPYSELYADIVAVLHSGKLTAVKDSLMFSGATEKAQLLAKYRDFSANIKTQGWKQTEAHDFFGPVRSYLGKYVLSDPQLRKDKNWLLNELTQVLMEEMMARAQSSRTLAQASPEELNVRLIERIHSHFSLP